MRISLVGQSPHHSHTTMMPLWHRAFIDPLTFPPQPNSISCFPPSSHAHWPTLLLPPSVLAGCKTEWDDIVCWQRAEVGQVVNVSCSEVFQHFSSSQGWFPRYRQSQQTRVQIPLASNKPRGSNTKAEAPLSLLLLYQLYLSVLSNLQRPCRLESLGYELYMQCLLARIYHLLWEVSGRRNDVKSCLTRHDLTSSQAAAGLVSPEKIAVMAQKQTRTEDLIVSEWDAVRVLCTDSISVVLFFLGDLTF